ncbi:hypothetical protein EYF80_041158 [Liparis tanakae]|uniref:Uncharacterized protein n=1 Tax=Liparis tanakae TaxID=230148 RepID=A0A4Z2G647_9TELE|nr:hypothetical protein EYF80_041158 [Liparis tanakae]
MVISRREAGDDGGGSELQTFDPGGDVEPEVNVDVELPRQRCNTLSPALSEHLKGARDEKRVNQQIHPLDALDPLDAHDMLVTVQ